MIHYAPFKWSLWTISIRNIVVPKCGMLSLLCYMSFLIHHKPINGSWCTHLLTNISILANKCSSCQYNHWLCKGLCIVINIQKPKAGPSESLESLPSALVVPLLPEAEIVGWDQGACYALCVFCVGQGHPISSWRRRSSSKKIPFWWCSREWLTVCYQ